MFCPNCSDPWDGKSVELSLYNGIYYCCGHEGTCGFHYDPIKEKRFYYINKWPNWFWSILCIISLFTISTKKRSYE